MLTGISSYPYSIILVNVDSESEKKLRRKAVVRQVIQGTKKCDYLRQVRSLGIDMVRTFSGIETGLLAADIPPFYWSDLSTCFNQHVMIHVEALKTKKMQERSSAKPHIANLTQIQPTEVQLSTLSSNLGSQTLMYQSSVRMYWLVLIAYTEEVLETRHHALLSDGLRVDTNCLALSFAVAHPDRVAYV